MHKIFPKAFFEMFDIMTANRYNICSGRARIEKCSGDTLYKIAKVLDVPMETLLEDAMGRSFPNPNTTDSETSDPLNQEYRLGFEAFKSNICHMVRDMGDLDFVINTLESGKINNLWNKNWYAEACICLLWLTICAGKTACLLRLAVPKCAGPSSGKHFIRQVS